MLLFDSRLNILFNSSKDPVSSNLPFCAKSAAASELIFKVMISSSDKELSAMKI